MEQRLYQRHSSNEIYVQKYLRKIFVFASDNAGDSDGIGRDDFGENIDQKPCGVQSRLVGCAGQGASHCVSFKLWGLDSRFHTFTSEP